MKFLTPIFIFCFVGVFVFMNRDFIGGWFSHVTPAPADSIRGEWVGHINITGIYDTSLKDFKKSAVIRFNLVLTDSFIKTYGGKGSLVIQGEAPRAITINEVAPDAETGDVRAGIWLEPYDKNSTTDIISGGFKGRFQPGSLELARDPDLGYVMKGVLHKGSDADFNQLVKDMQ